MEKMQYKLESFNGPLDLLLHLITKNKVSIWDIPIVEITQQYLEAIEGIEDSALEDTSEFLVMAAQLLYIKSKMLLPKPEEDDVANGITVFPVKSLFCTKPSTGHAAIPHHIG